MLAFLNWLERLTFLRGGAAAALVVLAVAAICVLWDWRVTLAALAIQYFLTDVAFLAIFDSRLVVVKSITSLFVWLILALTAYQIYARQSADERTRGPAALTLRLAVTALGLVTLWLLAGRPGWQLGALSVTLNRLVYTLTAAGAVLAVVAEEPFEAGAGLLLFLRGFELYYHSLEQSSLILAFLVAVNLTVALVAAYLMVTGRATRPQLPGKPEV